MFKRRKRLPGRNQPVLRLLLFFLSISISILSYGQSKSLSDTIRIGEVIVNGHPFLSGPGNNVVRIDSDVLRNYSHNNVSDVISENTPIFIKSYGSGGIATISLRGTGAGYTQLAWNGVNINSPMLGQTDLSLIPAGFIDDISIYYGGSSLLLNSGGIGGIINIETKPDWKTETNLTANLSAGSFGRYSGLFNVKTGNSSFQSSTKALFQSAENNFLYKNNFISNDPVWEHRKNAGLFQSSFMQELYFRQKRSVVSARVWYQNTNRDIPVPIVNQQPVNGEKQTDESLRTMINYSGYGTRSDYNTSLSWFSENLNYKNPLLSINSNNLANTIILKSGFGRQINEKTKMSLLLNDEISFVNSVNYNGKKSRNLAGLTLSVRRKLGDKLNYTALVTQTIKDNNLLIPDFSAGMDYKLLAGKEYFIKLNFSHNSRIPTLNDMYWNPGGNTGLKNEYSYTGEFTYEMNTTITPVLSITSQWSFYLISIDNMIKWEPGSSGYWSPSNVERAESSGAEGNVSLSYTFNSIKIKLNTNYSWNQAHILRSTNGEETSGNQLIYVPENQLNAGIRASYYNYYISWLSCFTGKRFTTSDNSQYLPGYFLNNLSAGFKFEPWRSSFDINLKVENLFNVNYQAIAWYPMPGRSFLLSIIYKLGI